MIDHENTDMQSFVKLQEKANSPDFCKHTLQVIKVNIFLLFIFTILII